ncbi:MAG: hypothetical protein ACYSUN_04620 [Planctomycetota bacterium]|jgi:hypothetical protein
MRLTLVILLFAAMGCGGSGDGAAAPADPTSPQGAFERFQAAVSSGEGSALLECVLAEDRDNTIAGYGAVVAAFAGTGAALPILKKHGASLDEGWGSKGMIVAKVADKASLLTELIGVVKDRRLVSAWIDSYGGIPDEVNDGMLMPVSWKIQKATQVGDGAQIRAFTVYRKQAVRCTFDLKRCGDTWCLAGPKVIWELLK